MHLTVNQEMKVRFFLPPLWKEVREIQCRSHRHKMKLGGSLMIKCQSPKLEDKGLSHFLSAYWDISPLSDKQLKE